MAKILINEDMFNDIPDFIDQLEEKVGHVQINRTMKPGIRELYFKYKDFADNEVVIARIYRNQSMKYIISNIQSTKKHFIQY